MTVPAGQLLDIGDPVGPIDLVSDDGQPWRLSDHRGRAVLLIFHRHLH